MKNFLKILFIVLIEQLIFVITFAFTIDKNNLLCYTSVILLIIYLIMYFYNDEIYELKISSKKFKLFFIPIWIIISILEMPIIIWLVKNGILPDSCGGTWICISNYILLPIYLVLFLITLGVIELITFISKKIK